jgi:hypothetical protein
MQAKTKTSAKSYCISNYGTQDTLNPGRDLGLVNFCALLVKSKQAEPSGKQFNNSFQEP